MATLEELNDERGLEVSLEDLGSFEPTRAPLDRPGDNKLMAGKVATLSPNPEEAVAVYDLVHSELGEAGTSETAEAILSMRDEDGLMQSRNAMVDFLANPNYTDEEKAAAAEQMTNIDMQRFNINKTVETAALSDDNQDLGHDETPESEQVRFSVAGMLDTHDEWKRAQQGLLNREASKTDPNAIAAWGEVFEFMMPYVEGMDVAEVRRELGEGSVNAYTKSIAALGDAKMGLREMLTAIPVEQRADFAEVLINAINNNIGSFIQDENDYARIDLIRTVVEDDYYGTEDKWLDNVIGALDSTFGGMIISRPLRALAGVFRANRALNSTAELTRHTNPSMARAQHQAVDADASGQTAQALHGTDRELAIADDLAPEVDEGIDAVRNKVNDPDRLIRTSEQTEIMSFLDRIGSNALRPHEEAKLKSTIVADFENAQGVTARREMFKVKHDVDSGEFQLRGVYGPSNNGFSTPREAIDLVSRALSKYNIPEQDIRLMRRNGETGDYEPVSLADVEAERALVIERLRTRMDMEETALAGQFRQGELTRSIQDVNADDMFNVRGELGLNTLSDYLVEVNYRFDDNPFDPLSVKRNVFDKMAFGLSNKIGSFTRHLFDPASMFDADKVTRVTYAGVERTAGLEKMMLNLARGYTDRLKKLPKDSQVKITEYLQEANLRGLPFDKQKLYADGFSESEVAAAQGFRDYWDTVFVMQNREMAQGLREHGWAMFRNPDADVRLVARAQQRQRLPRNVEVYDASDGSVKRLTENDLDDIYDSGGAVARLKDGVPVDGKKAKYVVTDMSEASGRMEPITDNTMVLNYRDGYYPVQYTDPVFIERVTEGGETAQAWATAGNRADADTMINRLQLSEVEEGVTYRARPPREAERSRSEAFEDDYNLAQARGFSAQRVRGKRLQGNTSNVDDVGTAGIMSPVDTMIGTARTLSNRVGMRKIMDTLSQRIIKQFDEYLPRDPVTGRRMIPNDIKEVKYRGQGTENRKELGNARSLVEYMKYLENGYINSIDDVYKNVFRRMSWIAGEAGNQRIEKAFQLMSETRGPSAMFRNGAFQMYIVLNPLRQWIVQSHQAVQLMATYPASFAKLAPQSAAFLSMVTTGDVPKALLKGTGWTKADAQLALKQWRESGLSAGVDKQNLIRASLTDMADRQQGKGIPLFNWARKVGFDAGEIANRVTSFLVHRDDAIRRGLDVTDERVIEDVIGQSSSFTYGMNRAGDMPYNQNFMGMLFQFMQVPHKAMLTSLTNRSLTRKQRAALVGFNAMMFSLPPAAMFSIFGTILPDEKAEVDIPLLGTVNGRDLVVSGLEGAMLNKYLTQISGEKTQLNYAGLAPNDQWGMFEFLHSMATLSPGEAVASTPAGQLFFGENARLANLLRTGARFGNFIDDFESPTEFMDVVDAFMSMSSGYSNAMKARLAIEAQKKLSASGNLSDREISRMEGWAAALGFGTMDEATHYWMTQDMYTKRQSLEEDVNLWYSDFKRHMMREGITVGEFEFASKAMSAAWLAFGNDNLKAKEMFNTLLSRDMNNSNFGLYRRALEMHGVVSNDVLRGYINAIPDESYENKQKMLDALDNMEALEND